MHPLWLHNHRLCFRSWKNWTEIEDLSTCVVRAVIFQWNMRKLRWLKFSCFELEYYVQIVRQTHETEFGSCQSCSDQKRISSSTICIRICIKIRMPNERNKTYIHHRFGAYESCNFFRKGDKIKKRENDVDVPLGCLLKDGNATYAIINILHDTNDNRLPIKRHVWVSLSRGKMTWFSGAHDPLMFLILLVCYLLSIHV